MFSTSGHFLTGFSMNGLTMIGIPWLCTIDHYTLAVYYRPLHLGSLQTITHWLCTIDHYILQPSGTSNWKFTPDLPVASVCKQVISQSPKYSMLPSTLHMETYLLLLVRFKIDLCLHNHELQLSKCEGYKSFC